MKSHPYDRAWLPFPHCVGEYTQHLTQPMRYRKPCMVRVGFDMFNSAVSDGVIDRVFAAMALCPQHTFQVLTKKPERMADYLDKATRTDNLQEEMDRLTMLVEGEPFAYNQIADGGAWPLPNVWLGTSVENQATADERIPHLLRCPAAVRFLSVELLLEAVNLERFFWMVGPSTCGPWTDCLGRRRGGGGIGGAMISHMRSGDLHWLILVGESGPGARPCHIEHVRSLVRQGRDAGVPVFVKQLGAKPVFAPWHINAAHTVGKWYEPTVGDDFDTRFVRSRSGSAPAEWPEDLRVREWPKQQQEQQR